MTEQAKPVHLVTSSGRASYDYWEPQPIILVDENGVPNPVDAATREYIDSRPLSGVDNGPAFDGSGSLDMHGKGIYGLASPGEGEFDAATKGYVDTRTARHFVKASLGTGAGTDSVWTGGASFNIVPLVYDAAASTDPDRWDATNHVWVIPRSGVYDIAAFLRVTDGAPANVNIGVGVDRANQDSSDFAWMASTGLRTTLTYARSQHFTVGDNVRLFAYVDFGGTITFANASMAVTLIVPDAQ